MALKSRKRHQMRHLDVFSRLFRDQEVDGSNPFAPTTYLIPFKPLQPFLKRARIRVSLHSVQLSAFLTKTASVQRTFWTEGGNPLD